MSDANGQAAVARIDRNVDRLPGLTGLRLIARAVERCDSAAA